MLCLGWTFMEVTAHAAAIAPQPAFTRPLQRWTLREHYASRAGQRSVCELLLDSGAHVNAQTHGGATPLHRAAYCGHYHVVQLLLERGGQPGLADDDGATPLHKAAEQRHSVVCQLLVNCFPALREVKDNRLRTSFNLCPEKDADWEFLKPPQ
ncbi:hypothetical protein DNTS_023523 [Danionella cerebrum]|uniref:Uncharacterized protein n=1 Tax=Danionella cerebrum TaxID=2873325 RepID=A0A553MTV7_9TELE|nr:hypothetical protein DNTS_023523 [Danionella translucida]